MSVPVGVLSGVVPSAQEVGVVLAGLARQWPGLCRMRRIGRSRQGRALSVLSVGSGRRAALVVGGPHPNEPVGYATIGALAESVVREAALRDGWTWHFLACADPDGAALNAGWTGAPSDFFTQHRYFFRPALAEQPEWTFPIPWEGGEHRFDLPENAALGALVDELEPVLVVSLHNCDFGSAFHVVDRPVPGLAELLAGNAQRYGLAGAGLPSDVQDWPSPVPGVYVMPPVEELVIRGHEQVPSHGAHLAHFAARYGGVTVLPEVPRWRAGRLFEDAPAAELAVVAQRLEDAVGAVRAMADAAGRPGGVFGRAVADTAAVADGLVASWRERAGAAGTVSGPVLADAHYTRVQLTLRALGMLARAEEQARPTEPPLSEPDYEKAARSAEGALRRRAARAVAELEVTARPLGPLVAVQAGAALGAAALLR